MDECRIRTLPAPAIALVMTRKGLATRAAAVAENAFGIALPMMPRILHSAGLDIVWCGPERWLVMTAADRAEASGGIETMLEPVFDGVASVAEQSGSRVLFEVSGNGAREFLSRTLPIDLHPSVFPPGHTALCRADYISLQIWQYATREGFVLALPRSYAARQTLLPRHLFSEA